MMADTASLIINGIELRLGYDALENILFLLEWDGPAMPLEPQQMQALLFSLSQSPNPKIREFVADRDFISPEIVELLSKDAQINVVRQLAANSSAARQMSQQQALRLFERDDAEVLESLGRCLDWYNLCDQVALGQLLAGHENPRIRAALAENQEAPQEVLQALLDDPDPDVAGKARHSLNEKLEYETSFDDDELEEEEPPSPVVSH